jgi:uncharacterized protein (TIGR00255 family)
MTGFGCGKAQLGDGFVVLEMRSVNHRFLEVRTRAPRELLAAESLVERLLRKSLSRGYCLVNVWYEGSLGGSTTIDKGALKSHLDSLVEVGKEKELCLTDLVPVLAGAPDIFTTPRVEDEAALESVVKEAFRKAVGGLLEMRETEGEAMAEELRGMHRSLSGRVKELKKHAESWPKIALVRLKERLNALLTDAETALDPGRLEAEAAMLAERADITEEVTRLESHLDQLSSTLESDAPVGRKIEFLIQEMGREANTIASKTALPEVSSVIIDAKTDLEKMRELAQNAE